MSPRLLSDQAKRQQQIEYGKRGGNPTLIAHEINKGNAKLALQAADRERRDKAAERQRRHRAKRKAEAATVMDTKRGDSQLSRDAKNFDVMRDVTQRGDYGASVTLESATHPGKTGENQRPSRGLRVSIRLGVCLMSRALTPKVQNLEC